MSSHGKEPNDHEVASPTDAERWRDSSPAAADGAELEEDDDDEVRVVPPDGGWGWMVVFSSFLIHIIADGIVYSFGIFFVEFVDYFGACK